MFDCYYSQRVVDNFLFCSTEGYFFSPGELLNRGDVVIIDLLLVMLLFNQLCQPFFHTVLFYSHTESTFQDCFMCLQSWKLSP